jgi:hypothetical protein
MKTCLNCKEPFLGRTDKKFCSPHCKSNFHYKSQLEKGDTLFQKIKKQLHVNRRLLRAYNKAGKAVVPKNKLLKEGFNPKYFTHYWKNQKADVYLFCFEYGFLQKEENGKIKYVLVEWQEYMN